MHADVHASLEALRQAVDAVEQCADYERSLGHLVLLARLLRDDPVLASALHDVENDALARDADRLAAIEHELAEKAEGLFLELGYLYRDRGPWREIVDAHPKLTVKQVPYKGLADALDRVATPFKGREAVAMTAPDMAHFVHTVSLLRTEIEKKRDPSLSAVTQMLNQLEKLGEKCRPLLSFQRLCSTGSVRGIANRLRSFLAAWDQRVRAGPAGHEWTLPRSNDLEKDVRTLSARIELSLNGLRSRRLVLYRAKLFFEHLIYDEARDCVQQEEQRVRDARAAGERAQAQRERALRRFLDRFIFQEGFFPVTEASASRGNLDLLLAEVDRVGVRPLVAEIKQAVRIEPDNVTRAQVQEAIDGARGEVERYVGHLRARPGWESIEPIIVVFHSSIEDVSDLEIPTVILIDIGSRSPSQLRARSS